jgi:Thioesterase superfamily
MALDVKINFLRAAPADGGELLATGTVLHRGKRLAIATAEVIHGDVRVAVLTGTTALAVRQPGLKRPVTSRIAALVGSHGVVGDLQRKAAPDQEAPGPVALTVAARARGEALLE